MKKNKKIEKAEQPALTDEQFQFLSTHTENTGDIRSTDEPFDKSIKARIARYAKTHKVYFSLIIAAIISFALVVTMLIVYFASIYANEPNKDNFVVRIGDNKYTAAYEDIMINDVMYIDMTKISLIDEIKISGDSTSRKFTLPSLQYVRFQNDSSTAIVDGCYFDMNAKAIINGNMCLVPFDFIQKIFNSGLIFTVDSEENIIKVERNVIGSAGLNKPIYEPLGLTNEIDADVTNVAYEDFNIDSTLYVNILDPKKDEYLILVNHSNPLTKNYKPSDLVQLTCDTNPANPPSYYSLRETPEKALKLMMDAMKNCGIDNVEASSTYRSYERQEEILQSYISNKMSTMALSYEAARNEVLKTSALPGHSEHQTGLSVDFVQGTRSLTRDFENSMAFKWLSVNAHKFGFILRYPSDKVSITGFDYEPWHYRFVGRTVASRIFEANVCFEEYVALS